MRLASDNEQVALPNSTIQAWTPPPPSTARVKASDVPRRVDDAGETRGAPWDTERWWPRGIPSGAPRMLGDLGRWIAFSVDRGYGAREPFG